MIDLRKLAALDIAFLGYRLILAEYVFGVVFSLALAIFILARGHSQWQVLLGAYFVCLSFNYMPMLAWTISIGSQERARAEIREELADSRASMARFRRISLTLLVPLLPVCSIVAQHLHNRRARG